MTAPLDRLRELFESALELPDAEREILIEQTQAEDSELADRLITLLDAERASLNLEPPGILRAPARAADDPPPAGTEIGKYRLGNLIATGGMGLVYEAEQRDPHRTVALKMMRFGFHSLKAARQFRDEAQLLARLHHPGIAQVYETGVHIDTVSLERPWFAMELVENASDIVTYCENHELDVTERLRLFVEVCDAVHHGHQRSIIHRDLKPDNILVDQHGHTKVIDFGVALATDVDVQRATLARTSGEVVGTLRYMSPEQLQGDAAAIDTRTDVHGLGLILYELLTGELPYDLDGKSLVEIARIVRDIPPRRPNKTSRRITGDLELILLKSIAKEPAQRYDSATAFAEDLRRWLRRDTIAARPPSLRYQLRMLGRRHRAFVAALAGGFLVAIAAAITSTSFWLRASAAEHNLGIQLTATQAAEKEATGQADRAVSLIEDLLDVAITMTDDFVKRLDHKFASLELKRDLAQKAVDTLEAVVTKAKGDPRITAAVARAHLQYAKAAGDPTRISLGNREAANKSFERAHALATELAAKQPDKREWMILLADTTYNVGIVASHDAASDKAIQHFKRSIEILEAADAQSPLATKRRFDIAHAWRQIGFAHAHTLDWKSAQAAFENALPIVDQVIESEPENYVWRVEMTIFQSLIATATGNQGETKAALATWLSAQSELAGLVADRPDNDRLWLLYSASTLEVCRLQRDEGLLEPAEAGLTDLLERVNLRITETPNVMNLKKRRFGALHSLGLVHRDRARLPSASHDDQLRELGKAVQHMQSSIDSIEEMARAQSTNRSDTPYFEEIRRNMKQCKLELEKLRDRE